MSLQSQEEQSLLAGQVSGQCSPRPSAGAAVEDSAFQMLRRFSHRCRNSLSGIKLGLYLMRKELRDKPACRWNDLGRSYDEIEKLFDRLDRIYQSASLALVRSPLGPLIADRLRFWQTLYPDWAHTIRLRPPQIDQPGDFDPSHLGSGLDAFVMWRVASGDSRYPSLSWQSTGSHFEILWEESPQPAANDAALSPGTPFGSEPGACAGALALLLLARVAADHGGDLETRRNPALNACIRWPQFREVRR